MDLLDFIPYEDGGRLNQPPPPPEPTHCPCCHHDEPNGFLLDINHGPNSYRATTTSMCLAMDLTLNHCTYWQRVLDGTMPTPASSRRQPVDAQAELRQALARAAHVWEHRPDDLQAALRDRGITRPEPAAPLEPAETIPPATRPRTRRRPGAAQPALTAPATPTPRR